MSAGPNRNERQHPSSGTVVSRSAGATGVAGATGPSWPGGDTHAGRFGRFGEGCAAQWYLHNGYRVLNENWRCSEGELDLIVTDGSAVVFVEVKARSSGRFGSGAEAVGHRKQRKLRLLATRWLSQVNQHYEELRFDVVDVDAKGTVVVHQGCF